MNSKPHSENRSSKFKDLVFGKDDFKGGKFDHDYSVSKAVNNQVNK